MKTLIALLICLATSIVAIGEERQSPNSEVRAAILHLDTINEYDRQYIRYFTTYAVPPELREKCVLTLSFMIHSLVGINDDSEGNAGAYYPLAMDIGLGDIVYFHLVEGSTTLHWIDLRHYNWTPESWEKMSSLDAYFVEPIIKHEENSLLRLLAGNAIVRADWFIVHAADTTKQQDHDIPFTLYDTLLYNGKTPKTADEWRKYWTLDTAEARKLGAAYASLVTDSAEVVNDHNRILFGYRTLLGWMYETYDVKNQDGLRDYVESFPSFKGDPPPISDAGEMFASNILQMQVYGLRNEKDEIVNFGDPTVVRHINDVIGDTRVRTAHSCFDCHAAGPLPAQNTIRDFIRDFGILQIKDKSAKLRVERVYLSNKFEDSIEDNQRLFARALFKVNGLLPAQNGANYLEIYKWYNQKLGWEQVSRECGIPEDEIKKKLALGLVYPYKVPGRLALLFNSNKSIPRDTWETSGANGIPGTYQQTMIWVNGLTIIKDTVQTRNLINYEVIRPRSAVQSGSDILYYLNNGDIVRSYGEISKDGVWISVDSNQGKGWTRLDNLKEVK